MAKHLGSVDELYYGVANGSAGQATTKLTAIKDVTISYTREDVDVSDRASGEWGSTIAGKKSCQLTFTYYDTNDGTGTVDATLEALLNAWHSGALVAMKAVSKSGRGIDADFSISNVEDNQSNEEAGTYAFTMNVNTDKRAPAPLEAQVPSASN